MGLLSQFSIRLVCGMCLVLAAMPQATVASGFFRTQMLIVMGLSTLAALAGGSAGALPVGWQAVAGMQTGLHIALAILAFYGSVLWTLERRKGATAVLWGLAAAALAALLLGVSGLPTFQNSAVGLLVVSEVSSAVLLGAAMCGMLLGHSYLTSPTMSHAPLIRLNQVLLWSAVLRGVTSAAGLIWAPATINLTALSIWLSLRWFAGVVGPIAMAIMVSRIMRYKNTQAATGVLFVAVILTFLSELTASLILVSSGWPL